MRRWLAPSSSATRLPRFCAITASLLCVVGTAKAGLYNPNEPDENRLAVTPKELINDFRARLGDLRSIAWKDVQFDNPLRNRYVLVTDLARGRSPEKLPLEQKISLSAAYLRRGHSDQALQLLQELERSARDNILVLSNLAMAYQQTGELDRASETLKHLLRNVWPEQWTDLTEPERKFLERIGWHQGTYEWNRKVEGYLVKLLRQKAREKLRPGALRDEKPYALFDDGKSPPSPVQFVGDGGKFEPGRIAAAEKAKLPRDAADIVQQLLIWLPDDNRLYWLLGEIYNARGSPEDLRAAFTIFDDLVDLQKRQYRPQELVEHYRALEDKVKTLPPPQVINPIDIDVAEKKIEEAAPAFDWRNLVVGFGSGVIFGVFALWQLREIRRRSSKASGGR